MSVPGTRHFLPSQAPPNMLRADCGPARLMRRKQKSTALCRILCQQQVSIMRALPIIILAVSTALWTTACGTTSTSSLNPVAPTTPVSSSSLTGTWAGAASDSSGTMMGAGLTTSMMNGMTWQVTQNGSTFSGSIQFAGHGGGTMMVSGTIAGHSGTFRMTIPVGSMMNGSCSAVATGTFDMDDLMTQIHGTYGGSNTCGGPFDHGQMSMTRR